MYKRKHLFKIPSTRELSKRDITLNVKTWTQKAFETHPFFFLFIRRRFFFAQRKRIINLLFMNFEPHLKKIFISGE